MNDRARTNATRESEVSEPDPDWPSRFRAFEKFLAPSLKPGWRLEHIGSTSVPGLVAKPILDVDLVVPNESDVRAALDRLADVGYRHEGDLGIAGREALQAPHGAPPHHLYVVVEGGAPLCDHLDLRNHLRSHPVAAARYEALKRRLAPLLAIDRAAYTAGKTALIVELLADARRSGTRNETTPPPER